MVQLGIFIVVLIAFAAFDLRDIFRQKLYRDAVAYCVLCAAAVALAAYYFPAERRSIVAFVNAVMRNGG